MGDNSDQNQKKRQNRDFIIPDLRNETDRQYQYSKRPYQREYLSGTEWDREEKDTTRKSGGNTNKKSRQNKVGKKKLNPTHAKAAKRNKNRYKKNNNTKQPTPNSRRNNRKLVGRIIMVVACVCAIILGNIAGRWNTQINQALNQRNTNGVIFFLWRLSD